MRGCKPIAIPSFKNNPSLTHLFKNLTRLDEPLLRFIVFIILRLI